MLKLSLQTKVQHETTPFFFFNLQTYIYIKMNNIHPSNFYRIIHLKVVGGLQPIPDSNLEPSSCEAKVLTTRPPQLDDMVATRAQGQVSAAENPLVEQEKN